MKILVTGSSGSLGAEICKQLDKYTDHEVIGVDKNPGEYTDYVIDLMELSLDRAVFLDGDDKFDVIIHCAATIFGVGGFNKYCADILADDTFMTTSALHRAVDDGSKFIYLSSSMVYEKIKTDQNGVTEDMTNEMIVPSTDYGLSKYIGERLVKAFAKQYGINYTIWRPFNIITPWERPDTQNYSIGHSHVFADFFKHIVIEKQNPLPIIGDGNQIRCFTWFEDVAACIIDNIDRADNETYNIGNKEPITMKVLAMLIVEEAKSRNILPPDFVLDFKTVAEYPDDVRIRIPNVDKANLELDWYAEINVRVAIHLLMDEWIKILD